MANEAITSGKITVNDPLKSDIAKLFDSSDGVETLQDIHLKGDVNTVGAFAKFNEILSKPELSKQDVLHALNEMNERDMLWHTSRSGWSSAAKPKKEVIESMASHLFARIQYNRILALTVDPDDKYLKEQLEDRQDEVIELLRTKETAAEITALFDAVKDQTKDKEDIQTAMEELGLEHDNDDKVKELFAEIQYNRIYAAPEVESTKLKAQLDDSVNEVIAKFEGLTEVQEVDDLIKDVQDQNKTKAEIETAMQELGLDDDEEKVKELFAENQYQRILEAVKVSNPKLHKQLKDRPKEVVDALVAANKNNKGEIDDLVTAVTNVDTNKAGIIVAMRTLGLGDEDANVKQIFAENQYKRILNDARDTLTLLHAQLKDKENEVIAALVAANKEDKAGIDELINAVKKKDKTKAEIANAMQVLGLEGGTDDKVKELFAENQYMRILDAEVSNPLLLQQLKAKPENVIKALITANRQNPGEIDLLVKAVKNPGADKAAIKGAMKEMGLEHGNDEIVGKLFAEAQYNRILELAKDNAKLQTLIGNSKPGIVDKLKDMVTVKQITDLFDKVKDPATNKTDVKDTMVALGLGDNDADVKLIFAENQYKRILKEIEKTNPKLHAQLSLDPNAVINALALADKADSTAVDQLVDVIKSPDTDKLGMITAMRNLGLEHGNDDKVKELFAENQYQRILAATKDTNPKLYAQLKAKPDDVINALVTADKNNKNEIDDLVKAVQNPDSDRDDIETAMHDLGLGNDKAKVNELFGENQYNKLAAQMEAHEDSNPKLYAYYKDPVKRVELIKKIGDKGDIVEPDTITKIVQILLSEPGKRFEQQKEFNKFIETHAQKLKPIDELDEVIHLYNPAFQEKARKDPEGMKKKYENSSQECAVMIRQLEMQLKELEAMKECLKKKDQVNKPLLKEEDLGANPFFGTAPAFDVLNDKTATRLREQLAFYKRVQDKIDNHILKAIDNAAQGSKKYIYNPDSVTSYNISRDQVASSEFRDKSNPQNTYLLTKNSGTLDFLLDDKPKKDEVRCFDVVFSHHRRDTGVDVKTEARFTYDANPPATSGSSMLKGDEISKTAPSKFEVLQFPRQPKPPAEQLSPRELAKAQVEFSMTMAIQALSTLDGPPTKDKPLVIRGFSGKEDEVAFLWTALVILGEKNPKMKFSPDAILVRGNSEFNPNEQRKRTLGIFEQLTDESYKKQVFDAFTAVVNNKTQDLTKMTEKRFDNKTIDKVEAGTEEATKEYKGKLLNGKKPAVTEQIENAEQSVTEDKQLGL
ncbi:hypothetical protein [Legionella longbeachae]|uniref:hypothetical protein n=1 Tax=Legionella longbeachae TaxID=450 RepID=UPI000A1C09C7|nr:hypothetical protein [Legionella longbeachae]ARM34609.1 hypothetical protein B0B39_14225 [Legionella longbeachae]HBD7396144.1 hypothetical protein [Legionella pneumophila]